MCNKGAVLKCLFRIGISIAGLILAVLILFVLLPSSRNLAQKWLGLEISPREKSLAVLPFAVKEGDASSRAFCDGLVEDLTSKLIQLRQFQRWPWVVPARQVSEWVVTSASEAKRLFKVTFVISGTLQRIGDMIRLTLSVVNTKTLRQLPNLEVTDHSGNILTLQKGIITRLAKIFDIEMTSREISLLTAGEKVLPRAYEFYLEGRGFLLHSNKVENLDSAISAFEQAIEQHPNYALAFAGLGEAYWLKYKLSKDPLLLEKAQANCTQAIQMNDGLTSAHITLAGIYKGKSQDEDSLREFQKAIEFEPQNFDAHLNLAIALEEFGKLTEAEKAYKTAIELNRSYWEGYINLGVFYYQHGRYREAEKMFRKATRLMPENVTAYNNLITVYYLLGQNDQAAAIFEKSIAIKPTLEAYSNMGTIYFYQGRYVDAMAKYEEGISLGEANYMIWANLADSYRYTPGYLEKAKGAYQHALQLAEELLSNNPSNALLRSSLALYHAKLGDQENALAEITQARQIAPEDPTILFKSIIVFELCNQRELALSALEEYLTQGGSLEEILKDPDLSGLRIDAHFQQLVLK